MQQAITIGFIIAGGVVAVVFGILGTILDTHDKSGTPAVELRRPLNIVGWVAIGGLVLSQAISVGSALYQNAQAQRSAAEDLGRATLLEKRTNDALYAINVNLKY